MWWQCGGRPRAGRARSAAESSVIISQLILTASNALHHSTLYSACPAGVYIISKMVQSSIYAPAEDVLHHSAFSHNVFNTTLSLCSVQCAIWRDIRDILSHRWWIWVWWEYLLISWEMKYVQASQIKGSIQLLSLPFFCFQHCCEPTKEGGWNDHYHRVRPSAALTVTPKKLSASCAYVDAPPLSLRPSWTVYSFIWCIISTAQWAVL